MIAKRVKFRSLSSKLLAIYVPLVCIAAFFLFAIIETGNFQSQQDDLVKELNELADVQNSAFVDALWELDTEQIQAMLAEMNSIPYVRGAAVYDSDNKTQAKAGDVESEPEEPNLKVVQALIHESSESLEI